MAVEVVQQPAAAEFNFDSACTSPFISAPSSPSRFGTPMFSAHTSPTHASAFYSAFNNFRYSGTTTNSTDNHEEDDSDFAFDFSGQLDTCSLPADELFDGGRIKPLKPPPCFQYQNNPPNHFPKSPRSPKKMFKETFSPRCKKKNVDDPFEVAIKNTINDDDHHRGRERNYNNFSKDASSFRSHKKTRSLSPFRVSDLLFENKEQQSNSVSNSSNSFFSSLPWFRKWRIKDFLLFRSASEGRAASKAQLNRYEEMKKRRDNNNYEDEDEDEDVKNSSFRSSDSSVGLVPRARRRSTSTSSSSGPISAHELHYTINRAFSEEMKRKTFLPYKQGWLACLGFNPAGVNEFSSRGNIGSMSRV